MKNIYLLYNCDEWKTHSSKSLVIATTSIRKLKKSLKTEIANKNMVLDDSCDLSKDNMYKIDTSLQYGILEVIDD